MEKEFMKELDFSIHRGAQISPHFLLLIETVLGDADFYRSFAKKEKIQDDH